MVANSRRHSPDSSRSYHGKKEINIKQLKTEENGKRKNQQQREYCSTESGREERARDFGAT
jgi:uncharacterized membrane protein